MRTWTSACIATVVVALFCSHIAMGDDLLPPSWPRLGEQNLSTSAEWEFLTGASGPGAEPDGDELDLIVGNGGGGPYVQAGDGMTWEFEVGAGQGDPWADGRSGSWVAGPAGGTLEFCVPNWIDVEPLKLIHVQIAFDSPAGTGHPMVSNVWGFDPTVGNVTGTQDQGVSTGPHFRYEDWRIVPNPDWEYVILDVPPHAVIDQVVIDTISLPEPATLSLLTLGALAVMRRKRK